YYLPYLLSTNDLLIDLEVHGWKMLDSREVKERYQLNKGDNLHGMLVSPEGKRYPFIVLIHRAGRRNIGKMVSEVARYAFNDMVLFTRTAESFEQALDIFLNNSDVLRYETFRVLPYSFSKYYLPKYDSDAQVLNYLQERHDLVLL